jgi:crossover junction endodeoxyribonuclease RuvC
MKTIGIDPGCSGAVVLFDNSHPVEWELMPVLKVGKNTRVNGAALAAFLLPWADAHVYLEHVGAMPGQGSASMFTFGHAVGVVEGVLSGLGIPYTLVSPLAWKKRAGLIGTDKDAARSRAIQLWPAWRDLDTKAKGQALADAALIAMYGREMK